MPGIITLTGHLNLNKQKLLQGQPETEFLIYFCSH